MVILFGNTKGGVGKSTLTLALANYLTQEHRRWVAVLDLDFKQSLVAMQQKSKILETLPLYKIHDMDPEQNTKMLNDVIDNPHKLLIIDLPSHLNDNAIIPYISAASLILCPFAYDEFTLNATLLFALLLSKINPKAAMTFLPNRIKNSSHIENREDIEDTLSKFGTITPIFYDKIDFQRLNNIYTPVSLSSSIIPVFDSIYNQYLTK